VDLQKETQIDGTVDEYKPDYLPKVASNKRVLISSTPILLSRESLQLEFSWH